MAFYTVTVESPLSVSNAWAKLSDVTRFAEWDPGVVAARQPEGDGPGPNASYILTVKGFRGTIDMRYDVVHFSEPERIILLADTGTIRSEDEIVIVPADEGCLVTYNAELTLIGKFSLFSPLMGIPFKRIGDRAAAGLRNFLETRVT